MTINELTLTDEVITRLPRRACNIYLPNCITIDSKAFADTSVVHVDAPNCTTVGPYAFAGCKHLQHISLPKCQTIDIGAFIRCKRLQHISLPSCEKLSSYVFAYCESLEYADMPNMREKGCYVYLNTPLAQEQEPLDGVQINTSKYISHYVNGCLEWYGTHTDKIPDNIEHITFPNCRAIYDTVDSNTLRIFEAPNVEYLARTSFASDVQLNMLHLPKLHLIDMCGCKCMNYLKYVSIDECNYIFSKAFYRCNQLREVSCKKVRYIGQLAFARCPRLSKVEIGNDCRYIHFTAFYQSPNINQNIILNIISSTFTQILSTHKRIPYHIICQTLARQVNRKYLKNMLMKVCKNSKLDHDTLRDFCAPSVIKTFGIYHTYEFSSRCREIYGALLDVRSNPTQTGRPQNLNTYTIDGRTYTYQDDVLEIDPVGVNDIKLIHADVMYLPEAYQLPSLFWSTVKFKWGSFPKCVLIDAMSIVSVEHYMNNHKHYHLEFVNRVMSSGRRVGLLTYAGGIYRETFDVEPDYQQVTLSNYLYHYSRTLKQYMSPSLSEDAVAGMLEVVDSELLGLGYDINVYTITKENEAHLIGLLGEYMHEKELNMRSDPMLDAFIHDVKYLDITRFREYFKAITDKYI